MWIDLTVEVIIYGIGLVLLAAIMIIAAPQNSQEKLEIETESNAQVIQAQARGISYIRSNVLRYDGSHLDALSLYYSLEDGEYKGKTKQEIENKVTGHRAAKELVQKIQSENYVRGGRIDPYIVPGIIETDTDRRTGAVVPVPGTKGVKEVWVSR